MSVLGGIILRATTIQKAGIFDIGIFGNFGIHAALKVASLEIDIKIKPTKLMTNERVYSHRYNGSGDREGVLVFPWITGSGSLTIAVAKTLVDIDLYDSGFALSVNTINTINIKIYGGDVYFNINGNISSTPLLNAIYYHAGSNINTLIGALQHEGDIVADNPFRGDYHHLKVYELDSSGNHIKDLIITDFSNGDINTVPNIGADKPASSDMTWAPAGSGTYVNIL